MVHSIMHCTMFQVYCTCFSQIHIQPPCHTAQYSGIQPHAHHSTHPHCKESLHLHVKILYTPPHLYLPESPGRQTDKMSAEDTLHNGGKLHPRTASLQTPCASVHSGCKSAETQGRNEEHRAGRTERL